jgi:hypothetical protein
VQGNPLFGKFGPIILLVGAQIVLALTAPSTAPNQNASALGGGSLTGANSTLGTTAGPAGTTPGVVGGGGPGAAVPGSTGAGPSSTGVAGGGATAAGSGSTAGAANGGQGTQASGAALYKLAGDRSHCVSGRQFDPKIDFYAPPCMPGKPGAAYPNNGGQTWNGVTGQTIEVVNYVADYGAEVDAILKAQGLYYSASAAQQWNKVFADFINQRFNLWGRKINIDTVQGTCTTVPPDYNCLTSEMDTIVAKYHPYAVFWETTLCSVCFAELSRLHVVNFGGSGFSDKFLNDNAPYAYEAGETASRAEAQFAQWWCTQMANKNAIFAGTHNPAQNFRNTKRQLGLTSTNDPDNKQTVQTVLKPALAKCGQSLNGHEYYYAQDINTATQQSQQYVAKMNTPQNPATSVLCLCDPVAPQFGQNAQASDNYWPESLIADTQGMDLDNDAQTYSNGDNNGDTLACPNGNPCPYDGTIGLSTDDPSVAAGQIAGMKIWNMMTNNRPLPIASGSTRVSPATVGIVWDQYGMLASLIQNTGPLLTPARMQAAAPDLGSRGGGTTGRPLRAFHPGSWGWTQDVRVVYWDKNKVSPYNNQKGTYVQIEGARFNGNFPSVSQPPAPAPENRK